MAESLQSLARTHYENFPVGSYFIVKELREPFHLVYAFARVADDIADESDAGTEARTALLDEWEGRLKRALAGGESDRFFRDLAEMIGSYSIPPLLFYDLISAFRMDAKRTEYDTFDDLKFYCRHSANPIGRILLYILGSAQEGNCRFSDAICTALQLTNFWQDLSIDIKRNRLYIPREDCLRFGVTRDELKGERGTDPVRQLLKFEVERTRQLFLEGRPLTDSVGKRFSFELKLTMNGGLRILEKIEAMHYDTLHRRPVLSKLDWVLIAIRSLRGR